MRIGKLLLLLGLFFYSAAHSQESKFNTYWDHGLKVESADGEVKLKFGGRIMADVAFLDFDQIEPGGMAYDVELRRARIFNSGSIYHNIYYKWQVDFAGGRVSLKDMYLGMKGIPVIGHLQVGHFKEPLRLNVLTSSKYITFMEPTMLTDYLGSRNLGLMTYNELSNQRFGWQFGLFRGTEESELRANSQLGIAATGRVSGLPLHKPSKRLLLHLGASFSYRSLQNHVYEISSRPEVHLAPTLLSTGPFLDVDRLVLAGGEMAFVAGPFSLQSEYFMAQPTLNLDANAARHSLSTFYGQASYFLTGEHREYKGSYGGFDRVSPDKNFGENGGSGAWEVGLRYSGNDLSDSPSQRDQLTNITAALNWYLNPSTRVMLNYVRTMTLNDGKGQAVQMRFQVDF